MIIYYSLVCYEEIIPQNHLDGLTPELFVCCVDIGKIQKRHIPIAGQMETSETEVGHIGDTYGEVVAANAGRHAIMRGRGKLWQKRLRIRRIHTAVRRTGIQHNTDGLSGHRTANERVEIARLQLHHI